MRLACDGWTLPDGRGTGHGATPSRSRLRICSRGRTQPRRVHHGSVYRPPPGAHNEKPWPGQPAGGAVQPPPVGARAFRRPVAGGPPASAVLTGRRSDPHNGTCVKAAPPAHEESKKNPRLHLMPPAPPAGQCNGGSGGCWHRTLKAKPRGQWVGQASLSLTDRGVRQGRACQRRQDCRHRGLARKVRGRPASDRAADAGSPGSVPFLGRRRACGTRRWRCGLVQAPAAPAIGRCHTHAGQAAPALQAVRFRRQALHAVAAGFGLHPAAQLAPHIVR